MLSLYLFGDLLIAQHRDPASRGIQLSTHDLGVDMEESVDYQPFEDGDSVVHIAWMYVNVQSSSMEHPPCTTRLSNESKKVENVT